MKSIVDWCISHPLRRGEEMEEEGGWAIVVFVFPRTGRIRSIGLSNEEEKG
jgi:hypothetical protein